ncbi:MAG: hypothetical protein PF495_18585, partial [Spirochaetales bacterium]|nr:hypothetical protein [Spirochaetales bacterium]
MNSSEFARMIDHTLLKPGISRNAVYQLCGEASEFQFATVAIQPCTIPYAHKLLAGTGVWIT